MDLCAATLPQMRDSYISQVPKGSNEYIALMKPRKHPVNVNPFHRPGQRPISIIRTPNCYSGFTMPVVVNDTEEARKENVVPAPTSLADLD
jgi:hypothetical protein